MDIGVFVTIEVQKVKIRGWVEVEIGIDHQRESRQIPRRLNYLTVVHRLEKWFDENSSCNDVVQNGSTDVQTNKRNVSNDDDDQPVTRSLNRSLQFLAQGLIDTRQSISSSLVWSNSVAFRRSSEREEEILLCGSEDRGIERLMKKKDSAGNIYFNCSIRLRRWTRWIECEEWENAVEDFFFVDPKVWRCSKKWSRRG